MSSRQLFYALPLIVLLGLALVFVMRIIDEEAADRTLRPMLGKSVPALELPVLGDPKRQVSAQDFAGHWLLVNLWGSWCAPCRQEHGELMRISREEDMPIFGINTWDTYQAAQDFLAELGDPFDVVGFDVDGEARLEFAVTGVPETLLVDPNGVVVVHHIGPLSTGLFEQVFREHFSQ